jgi:hypothetical protein
MGAMTKAPVTAVFDVRPRATTWPLRFRTTTGQVDENLG